MVRMYNIYTDKPDLYNEYGQWVICFANTTMEGYIQLD